MSDPRTLRRRTALAAIPVALLAAAAGLRPGPVRLETRVPVDGARLYVEVRGEQRETPILLWLHGGPGGAERPLFRLFNSDLERRFVVAYLDQRGAGRSFDKRADPRRLTVAQHLQDLDAVVDWLQRTLGGEKVILLGHSWGSALGFLYARRRPEKVAAMLGVGVVTSTVAGHRAQVDFVRAEATRRGDDDVLRKVAKLGSPPLSSKADLELQTLVDRYGGYFHRKPNFAWSTAKAVAGGITSPWEIARIIQGNNVSLAAMNAELAGLDMPAAVPGLQVPTAFLLGRHDRKTDSRLAAAWFEGLVAPRKRLIWFENSAHNVPFEEPEAFNAAVPRVLGELGVS
jgi:proline iminopeptidase